MSIEPFPNNGTMQREPDRYHCAGSSELPRYLCTEDTSLPPEKQIVCDVSSLLIDSIREQKKNPSSVSSSGQTMHVTSSGAIKREREETELL